MAECKLSHPSLIDKSDDLFHIQGREREKGRERETSVNILLLPRNALLLSHF